ncbi:MAG TPA: AtpZ/AtpI family protein [Segeticoccus sp.]|uniref:AtpZ/AtpI family protein n=1 Tax=Segeticoccus sp. TaxID=2706531 RepID=UPI002D7F57EA|nr:AtpZ/AtpI family protein [Segeticoccus sp.]HET8601038.1 AtpZ/AtpI family protein [Segeticoccus sp.]
MEREQGSPREPEERPDGSSGPPDPDAGYPGMQRSPEWDAMASVISGPIVFGGIGWLLDHFLHLSLFLPIGIIGGMALSLYLLWFRYGTH